MTLGEFLGNMYFWQNTNLTEWCYLKTLDLLLPNPCKDNEYLFRQNSYKTCLRKTNSKPFNTLIASVQICILNAMKQC